MIELRPVVVIDLRNHLIMCTGQGYYINLDPAVRDVPFGANIDIRDTVNYKEVMK